jgi:hypothetical protein
LLAQRNTGQWPRSIAIEDASGTMHGLELDPREAECALSEAETAREQFNQEVVAGSIEANARPSAERCRWCDFRVLCGPFWTSLTADWEQRAAMGAIRDAGAINDGAYAVIDVERPSHTVGRRVHVSLMPGAIPSDATRLAVVDWQGAASADSVRARWSTLVRAW